MPRPERKVEYIIVRDGEYYGVVECNGKERMVVEWHPSQGAALNRIRWLKGDNSD